MASSGLQVADREIRIRVAADRVVGAVHQADGLSRPRIEDVVAD